MTLLCDQCDETKRVTSFSKFRRRNRPHLCKRCALENLQATQESFATPSRQRNKGLRRWAKYGSKGFATFRKRSAGVRRAVDKRAWSKRPPLIAVVKYTYYGGAAVHVEDGMLSNRLCLKSLRIAAAKGKVPKDTLIMGLAADMPQLVARLSGFPGHSAADWPAGNLLSLVRHGWNSAPANFQEDHPERVDGGRAYRKLDAEGGDAYSNFEVRDARHPFRGEAARGRAAAALRTLQIERDARKASGMTWDAYMEYRHRLKDFQGHVLGSRRYVLKLDKGGLAPPPAGPLQAAIDKLTESGEQRFGFPMFLKPGTKLYETAWKYARKAFLTNT